MEIDTQGTFNASRAAFPELERSGNAAIVNISATLHYGASWYQAHASAAKVCCIHCQAGIHVCPAAICTSPGSCNVAALHVAGTGGGLHWPRSTMINPIIKQIFQVKESHRLDGAAMVFTRQLLGIGLPREGGNGPLQQQGQQMFRGHCDSIGSWQLGGGRPLLQNFILPAFPFCIDADQALQGTPSCP